MAALAYPASMHHYFSTPPAGSPQERALELFKRIATLEEFEQLIRCGGVVVEGKYANYVATQNGSTAVLDEMGNMLTSGCLGIEGQEMLHADMYPPVYPPLDHFIANYMLFKSPAGERIWWNKANVGGSRTFVDKVRQRIEADFQKTGSNMVERFKRIFHPGYHDGRVQPTPR